LLEPIGEAFGYLLTPGYWGAVFTAVGLAMMASVIPGVNSFLVMALAIAIIVFNVDDPAIGIVLLATITGVDNTLDSIPAVLYGQPGAATQVTFLEGHQLARRGKAAHTLGAVYAVSAMGGVVGAVVLVLAIPVIRPFVLKFGFAETGAMALVGLAMISVLGRGAVTKGLIAAMLGLLIGLMGRDPFVGQARLTIGPLFGPALIPAVLGLFAFPEMIDLTLSRQAVAPSGANISNREVLAGAREGLRHWRMVIRQSLFGVFLGAIPGVGSAVIDWLAYAFGIFLAKDRTQFGKGSLEGVMFAESAQNAKEGGQAIPTLAMGVPGGPTWVLVMAGMIAYGVAPGPEMLGSQAHITILLVITLAIGNLLIAGLGLLVTGQLARLTTVPYPIIGGIIIPITLLSAFVDTTNWRGIQTVLVMGAIGLVMKHFGWPRPPMLLAFILAPIIERNVLNGVAVQGIGGLLTDGLTMTIVGVAALTAFFFARAMGKLDREEAHAEALLVEAEVEASLLTAEQTGEPAHAERETTAPWYAWRAEYIVHAVLIVVSLLWLWDAKDYTRNSWRFPVVLSTGVLALTIYHAYTLAFMRRTQGAIMDLGMISASVEGSRRAAIKLGALMALFLLVGITIHLAWAAVLLGTLIPIVMLRGFGRFLMAVISGGVVFLFALIVLENILFVIWPEPFVTGWDVPWGVLLPKIVY